MHEHDSFQGIPILVEEPDWKINTGSNKIHAKRKLGKFRNIKTLTASLWLVFFLGPYLRWGDRQAVLLDIANTKFQLFAITVYPHDIWILSFILLFFAMLLALASVLVGRAFCGYFCFQTVWTDLFSWIEEKIEGSPRARTILDVAPWSLNKLSKRISKHSIWLLISMLTGISFAAWFTDAYQLWIDLRSLQAHISAWIVLLVFTIGTYLLAGFMREQVCFWLCPYGRIQGVFYDNNTLLPVYDETRGEPRAKLNHGAENQSIGCIDCNQCVAVCPTGVDIREGQQIGCITCGLCIDACDNIMNKINQPTGLIRYDSLNGLLSVKSQRWFQRPQVLISAAMVLISAITISFGISQMTDAEISIHHNRNPMYVTMSDGTIQNGYMLGILNKSNSDSKYLIKVTGIENIQVTGNEEPIIIKSGELRRLAIFIRKDRFELTRKSSQLSFQLSNMNGDPATIEHLSFFISP